MNYPPPTPQHLQTPYYPPRPRPRGGGGGAIGTAGLVKGIIVCLLIAVVALLIVDIAYSKSAADNTSPAPAPLSLSSRHATGAQQQQQPDKRQPVVSKDNPQIISYFEDEREEDFGDGAGARFQAKNGAGGEATGAVRHAHHLIPHGSDERCAALEMDLPDTYPAVPMAKGSLCFTLREDIRWSFQLEDAEDSLISVLLTGPFSGDAAHVLNLGRAVDHESGVMEGALRVKDKSSLRHNIEQIAKSPGEFCVHMYTRRHPKGSTPACLPTA